MLGEIGHRAHILEVALFISDGMRHHVDVFDRTIRHKESMFKIQVHAALDSAIECLLYAGNVFRMNPLEHQFNGWLRCWSRPMPSTGECTLASGEVDGRYLVP